MTKRRDRVLLAFFAAALIGGILLSYAYFIEPSSLVVSRSTLRIKNWDPAFNDLKIVMIADIHGGSNNVTEAKIREVVARANAEDPDLVVLLGDYVSEIDHRKAAGQIELRMPVETIAASLSGLTAKYGVFAVLGNHDGIYGDQSVADALTRVGYRVLQNEVAIIEKDGRRLRLFGMKDHLKLDQGWLRTSADSKAIVSMAGTGDLIVLQHSPDILPVIAGEFSISPELRLILAGHTHGGQVRLPIFGTPIVPSGFGQKFARGHVREKDVDMFITSGVGTSVLPFRFRVPPEIAVLTVRAAD